MAIRYTATAQARDGATVTVKIDDPAYAGSPVALQLAGVRLAYGEEGRDWLDSVVASRLSVELFVPETEDVPAALAAADDYWTVVLERDGGELWRGLLVQDMIARPLEQETYRLSIQAVDGLGLLEDELWLDADGNPFEGEATLAQILASALASLGLGLGLAAAVAWTPGGASGSSLDATVRREALLKDGRAPSRLDVIRQVVGRFGARILQHGGRWHVVQRELFRLTGSQAASLYDATGAPEGTASVDLREALSGVRIEAHELWRPAVREAAVRYDHGPLPDLIKAGDFRTSVTRQRGEPLPPDPLDYWTLYGGSRITTAGVRRFYVGRTPDRSYLNAIPNNALEIDAIFHGSTKDPVSVRQAIYNSGNYAEQVGGEVLTGQRLLFSADVALLYKEGEGKGRYMTYYALNIQGTDYYLKYDGTWGQSSTPADWVQPIMDDGPEWGANGLHLIKGQVDDGSWTRLQIYTDPAPASGPVRLRLYGSSDISGSKRDVKSALWDNVSVQIVDDSGETFEALVTEAWRTGRGVRLDEIAFRIGEGPIPAVPGAIRWGGTMAQNWRRAGDATDYALDALWLDGVLRQAARPLRTRREDRSGWLPTPWKAVEDGGTVYSIEAVEIDPVVVRVRLELVEVRWDAVTYVLGSAPTGEGVPVSGGGGGASAAAGASLSVVTDLSQAYRTGPFAVLQSDVAAGSVSQLVVDSVGGIPFLQLPPAGAYIRIVHPVTGTIVDAYVASALLDLSGMSATLEVRDVGDTTQPLSLPEDFPAGAPVWLSAIWALANVETKVPRSLWQAKGDLAVADGTGAPTRLPVGSDGQILAADSAESVGLKWIDPPSGGGSTVTDLGVSMHAVRRGTATIGATQTSVTVPVAVSEGLDQSKVQVTPLTTLGSATRFWVANVSSGSFDIVLDAQPGQDVTFAWWVIDDSEIAYVEVVDFYWSGYFSGVTNITLTIPTTTQEGDLLLAILMTRPGSPPPTTTGPTGWVRHDWAWTLSSDNINQYIEVWKKTAVSGDAGQNVVFTQPTSGRMAGILFVLRSSVSGRTPAIVRTAKIEDQDLIDSSAPVLGAIPIIGVPVIGGIEIGCYTNVFADTSSTTTIAFPDDWTQSTPVLILDNRLGVAWRMVYPGIARQANIENYSTSKHWASMALVIAP